MGFLPDCKKYAATGEEAGLQTILKLSHQMTEGLCSSEPCIGDGEDAWAIATPLSVL